MRFKTAALIITLALIGLTPASSVAQAKREEIIVRSQFQVEPGEQSCSSFALSTYVRHGRIAGNTMAQGGSNNDIRVLILKEVGGGTTVLYDRKDRSVVLSVPVTDPGKYFVCFDNSFSLFSIKDVTADIRYVHEGADVGRAEEVKRQATERERRIGRILARLIPTLKAEEEELGTHQITTPIYFTIVDDPALNAWADWTRRVIGMNRGTVELAEAMPTQEGDDMLAAVLGHELAHIFYRHTFGNPGGQAAESGTAAVAGALMVHPLVGLLAGALAYDRNRRYDRQQETDADILGVRLACAAGFDPAGALVFMAKVREEDPNQVSFLQTHPSPDRRVEYLEREVDKLNCSRKTNEPDKLERPEEPDESEPPIACPPGTYWMGKGCTSR